MKKILDELYFGNIVPDEQYIVKGSEYEKEMHRILEYEETLEKILNKSEKEILIKYRESSLNINSITSKEMWKKGFIMGLRIGIEVMDNPAENLKNITENTD